MNSADRFAALVTAHVGERASREREAHLEAAPGEGRWFDRPETAPALTRDLFRTGARFQWNDGLRRLTGESLSPRHYVAQYVAAP